MISGKILGFKYASGKGKDGKEWKNCQVYIDKGEISQDVDGLGHDIATIVGFTDNAQDLYSLVNSFEIGDSVIVDANKYNGVYAFGESKYFVLDPRNS